MVLAVVVASFSLINELPITNQIVSDARFLHPILQMDKNATSAIRILATNILATFLEDFIKKEFKSTSAKVEIITDEIASEFSKYQMESIPNSYDEVETTEKLTSNRVQSSYWKYAYAGIYPSNFTNVRF